MPYSLSRVSSTLTRPNNTTVYSTFGVIAAANNSCFAFPLRSVDKPVTVQGVRVTVNWDIAASPNNIRLYFFDRNPVPTFANVDNSSVGGSSFAALPDALELVTNVSISSQGGLSSGITMFATPLVVTSADATLYCIAVTTTGTTSTPALGQIRLDIFVETPDRSNF